MGVAVSIIIPCYGPKEFLDQCLDSLANDGEEHEIICVDNGVGYEFPENVIVIRNAVNEKFAHACNQGAEIAQGTILAFLNMDAWVTPGWLTPLVKVMQIPNVVMAGPKLLYPDGRIQCAGIVVHRMGGHNRLGDEPSGLAPGVTGACACIYKDIFNEINGYDEDFVMGFEDVSMCLTLQNLGYDIYYENSSIVYHRESACGHERWSNSTQNTERLRAKWAHLPDGVIDASNRGVHPGRTPTTL